MVLMYRSVKNNLIDAYIEKTKLNESFSGSLYPTVIDHGSIPERSR
jgi:hypothetical protein